MPGKLFAQPIVQRGEELLLNGCQDPCLSVTSAKVFLKLKKDYIAGLGNTADFAIVGRHRDARDEQELALEIYVTYHSILDVWSTRVKSAVLILSRDFVSLIG